MSIYSTDYISREDAEQLVQECRMATDRSVKALSDEELDKELQRYVYARTELDDSPYNDILPWGRNYIITSDRDLLANQKSQ